MRTKRRYSSSTDVARLAGVSQSAVSRTYSESGRVSDATRQKVFAAAEKLGYRPSVIPRIMLTHRSRLVAMVIGGMYNPFYALVLERFTKALQDTGHQVLLFHVDSGDSLDAVLPRLTSYRVDAVVSALAVVSQNAAEEFARIGIPVVSFNTPVNNNWVSSVCCDNAGSAAAVADLFVARGARSFAFISGPPGIHASEERLDGYRRRLGELGFPDTEVVRGDFQYRGGRAAALDLESRRKIPDAIFCANDLMALGAVDALRGSLDLRVPDDVMVAGFDDIPSASWGAYDLTTVVQDASAMVEQALSILYSMSASPEANGGFRAVLPGILVERSTTRKAEPPCQGNPGTDAGR